MADGAGQRNQVQADGDGVWREVSFSAPHAGRGRSWIIVRVARTSGPRRHIDKRCATRAELSPLIFFLNLQKISIAPPIARAVRISSMLIHAVASLAAKRMYRLY
jgi:hypothetical protein